MQTLSACSSGKRLAILLSLVIVSLTDAFPQNLSVQTDPNTCPLVTVPLTETRSFYSKIQEQEMVLFIKIPATYKTNTQKIYPCWYCTDGNRSFPMIADMASYFEIPVIVEPGYPAACLSLPEILPEGKGVF